MFNKFVNKLKIELTNELPGNEAHIKMMPQFRELKQVEPGSENKIRKGSVLLLLYPQGNDIMLFLIKRAKDGGSHSGQMAFPGGKYDKIDGSMFQTAIRETQEETGIEGSQITILGALSELYIHVSNFLVLPVIGYMDHRPIFKPNFSEVQDIVEISMKDLKNPTNKLTKEINIHNIMVNTPFFNAKGNHIWGATAMIISEFLAIVERINIISYNSNK